KLSRDPLGANRRRTSYRAITPPPTTHSPRYQTTDCPGAMARCGSSNTTSAVSASTIRPVAGAGAWLLRILASTRHPAPGREHEAPRVSAHLVLRQGADGKPRRGGLRLRERAEEVGLVLPRVNGAQEQVASRRRVAGHARVMARRDGRRLPGSGASQERAEFQ